MSGQAVIDSLEFARSGGRLEGEVPVSAMPRLQESLHDDTGTLAYTLKGGQDARGRPHIRITVKGVIHLVCQRCLGSLDFDVDTASDVLVLSGGTDSAAEQMVSIAGAEELDDLDGIPADPRTEVAALVEDEALLALPMAPAHAPGRCKAAHEDEIHKESPFAALAALKTPAAGTKKDKAGAKKEGARKDLNK